MTSTKKARVEIILELLVAGLSRRQILEHASKKLADWQASPRTIDRFISAAHALLEQEARPIRAREFGKALRRLDSLFARCMQITDYKGALAVERERIALLNLSHTWPLMRPVAATAQATTPTAPPIRRLEVAAHA